jgi:hypothetical protein
MDSLIKVLNQYGPWGLILVVIIYILIKGEIAFRYPRPEKKGERE